MRFLYVTQEYAPYFTEGGLGLTSRALPKTLQDRHGLTHDIVLPGYSRLLARHGLRTEQICRLPARMIGGVTAEAAVLRLLDHDGPCEVFLIEADTWYGRDGIYRDSDYREFGDAVERAAFFGASVAAWIERTGASYDLVHANDWQSGAVLAHLRARRRGTGPVLLMNIHSAVYEGQLPDGAPAEVAANLGLPDDAVARMRRLLPDQGSMLALGLLSADAAVTCSPTYARELPDIHSGSAVAKIWAEMRHTGIVSGVDRDVWDPAAPARSSIQFDRESLSEGKRRNKERLQSRFGLRMNAQVPVIGICSRFIHEKGTDLLLGALPSLLAEGAAQTVLMGPTATPYRGEIAALVADFPDSIAYVPRFEQEAAWLVYAGSDITVMPSRVEPCGLNQLIAMSYGTLPVVSPVGGLKDTVTPLASDGTGWIIPRHTPEAVLTTTREALAAFRHRPSEVHEARRRAIAQDWSWARTADEFTCLYRSLGAAVLPSSAGEMS
jgi:starch synthase